MLSYKERVAAFQALYAREGLSILANPRDVGTARRFASPSFVPQHAASGFGRQGPAFGTLAKSAMALTTGSRQWASVVSIQHS